MPRALTPALSLLLPLFLAASALARGPNPVERLPGRSESEVRSRAFRVPVGRTVRELRLPERLERLGFQRVRRLPRVDGEYFWGHRIFWIRSGPSRHHGKNRDGRLTGFRLDRSSGRILGLVDAAERPLDRPDLHLPPELLAESLDGDRASRIPVRISRIPDHVWKAVLAAEDHRFFDHPGIDPRGIARALVENVRAGGVRQGGSTITQQLIKNRELTPRRTLGRKISEAARALALESEYSKQHILEAYLNSVYLGHIDGLALHGVGRAARTYFSKPVSDMTLQDSALLAGIIRSPNGLSPLRHPEAARERRDVVLSRMLELGWIESEAAEAARAAAAEIRATSPPPPIAPDFLDWVAEIAAAEAPRRVESGRGVVADTTLDPWLQARAERAVARAAEELTPSVGSRVQLSLVALDSLDGSVLAYVGGADRDGLDRVRRARRQPGSTLKPLILLEAFETCGPRPPVHPATRILDEELEIDLPSGRWAPRNDDRSYRGVIELRKALEESRNVPFVRLARWCGFENVAERLRRAGLELPDPAPPSFVLGSVETTPLKLAEAYTVFGSPGRWSGARPVVRLERPAGRRLERVRPRDRRVSSPAAAWLVRDLLRSVVEEGTARSAALAGTRVWAKTGTSSDRRDAWMAGLAGRVVLVVWAGRDDGGRLGLSGSRLGPWWRDIASDAAGLYPLEDLAPPRGVVERWVDPDTGLLVRSWSAGARQEYFLRGAVPRRDRFWRSDDPESVVR